MLKQRDWRSAKPPTRDLPKNAMSAMLRHTRGVKSVKRGPREGRRPVFESMRAAGFVPSFGVRSLGVRIFYKRPLLQQETRFFDI